MFHCFQNIQNFMQMSITTFINEKLKNIWSAILTVSPRTILRGQPACDDDLVLR